MAGECEKLADEWSEILRLWDLGHGGFVRFPAVVGFRLVVAGGWVKA
jgi:hypothetical protein